MSLRVENEVPNQTTVRAHSGAVNWEPGTPLYGGPGVSLPLFSITDDLEVARWNMARSFYYCPRCEVSWNDLDRCWFCGRHA